MNILLLQLLLADGGNAAGVLSSIFPGASTEVETLGKDKLEELEASDKKIEKVDADMADEPVLGVDDLSGAQGAAIESIKGVVLDDEQVVKAPTPPEDKVDDLSTEAPEEQAYATPVAKAKEEQVIEKPTPIKAQEVDDQAVVQEEEVENMVVESSSMYNPENEQKVVVPPQGLPAQSTETVRLAPKGLAEFESAPDPEPVEILADHLCQHSPKSALHWGDIQQKFRYMMSTQAAFTLVPSSVAMPQLDMISKDLKSINDLSNDDCTIGKWMIITSDMIFEDDDGTMLNEYLTNREQLTSPLMTLLLDIPWKEYLPKWPFMQLLSQMSIRRRMLVSNTPGADGLDDDTNKYVLMLLEKAIATNDVSTLKALCREVLMNDQFQNYPYMYVTIMYLASALTDEAGDGLRLFEEAEQVTRQIVTTLDYFSLSLSTRWPMWNAAAVAAQKWFPGPMFTFAALHAD